MNTRGRIVLGALLAMAALCIPHIAAANQNQASVNDAATPIAGSPVPSTGPDENGSALHSRNWRYTVQPSDTLQLGFMLSPEFNQTVTVQPDGYITLLYVGDVSAGGLTLPQLTDAIKTAYSKILHDPVISVAPTEFEKPYFVVGGQVAKPGKLEWHGEVTVTQAIAMAGGFTDAAKHSQVLLFRRVSDQWTQAKIINVKQMLNSRNLQEDPELRPGDMLFVPKNALSKIKPFLPTSTVGAYYNPAIF